MPSLKPRLVEVISGDMKRWIFEPILRRVREVFIMGVRGEALVVRKENSVRKENDLEIVTSGSHNELSPRRVFCIQSSNDPC